VARGHAYFSPVHPKPPPTLAADRVLAIVREETEAGRSLRDSVRAAARVAGWKEQEIYRLVRERGAGPPP